MDHFHTATLKLTAWYLTILMVVSLAFSAAIYEIASHEFDRPLPPEIRLQTFADRYDTISAAQNKRADESKQNILIHLLLMNLVTLTLGAGASYYFARRTLLPIEKAMESQAQFTSDASHELRTPLAVIRTENEIALRAKKTSIETLRSVVASNLEEIERLQLLTDRLLALSSEQQIVLEPFDANDAVAEAVARQQPSADKKSIKLKVTPGKKSLIAHGNIDTICDTLSILIENAIKYSPAKTTVTVSTVARGNSIDISVADQGAGIAEADIDRIFDRFYRADQSRSKENVEGHGLGLALAKRLADQNNATLSVKHRKPRGTIFTLQLGKSGK